LGASVGSRSVAIVSVRFSLPPFFYFVILFFLKRTKNGRYGKNGEHLQWLDKGDDDGLLFLWKHFFVFFIVYLSFFLCYVCVSVSDWEFCWIMIGILREITSPKRMTKCQNIDEKRYLSWIKLHVSFPITRLYTIVDCGHVECRLLIS
jgi:hypothetical protein